MTISIRDGFRIALRIRGTWPARSSQSTPSLCGFARVLLSMVLSATRLQAGEKTKHGARAQLWGLA